MPAMSINIPSAVPGLNSQDKITTAATIGIILFLWYCVWVTIPSSHLERVMTSPEVERSKVG